MLAIRNWTSSPLKALRRKAWPLPSATAPRLDSSQLVEEENTPYYNISRFYPARLGEVLNNRYQIATKLGYGVTSTVWLARDLYQWRWSEERYVAIKILARSRPRLHQRATEGELNILRHISKRRSRHEGWHFVRKLLGSFTLQTASGDHTCLVFELLREPLWIYRQRWQGDVIPPELLKIMLQMILQGLSYLQSECHIIHTDLKPDNIMVKIENKSIVEQNVLDEFHNPFPQKHLNDGRIIYMSRNDLGPPVGTTGLVTIADFDLAVRGDEPNSGFIQAQALRAPEVIVDAGYSYSADIWNLGVMLWDVLEGKALFEAAAPRVDRKYEDGKHLAYITALLGPPPQELLKKGRRTQKFYDAAGDLKGIDIPTNFSFETTLTNVKGEEKKMFIAFVKRMLKWKPEERSAAEELLGDPWLYTDFDNTDPAI
ncbi:kinase-like protein [Xylona heveae TC161]|uniref:non-specific serine/threonine protein kinase n=1 Tax=Xylona heveae (strain CBS 132557 / TC161) TaxID=1328760 RepID=A0A165F9Q5_XYLHT|nr:kinase-like protein [Xylona heveae TC161]KZF20743.1 kinase-like protein [Xylona heveae TC161]